MKPPNLLPHSKCKFLSPLLLFSLLLSPPPQVGWVTSSLATAAASTCWRRATSGISMSTAPAVPRCSPLGASATCSGTHTAATPCPPSETQRGRGREGLEERRRSRAGEEMEGEVEEGGRRRREGGRGCNIFPCAPKSLEGLSAGWRSYL